MREQFKMDQLKEILLKELAEKNSQEDLKVIEQKTIEFQKQLELEKQNQCKFSDSDLEDTEVKKKINLIRTVKTEQMDYDETEEHHETTVNDILEKSEKEYNENKHSLSSHYGSMELPQDWEALREKAEIRDKEHAKNQSDMVIKEKAYSEGGNDFGAKMTALERARDQAEYSANLWNDISIKENIMRPDSKEFHEYTQNKETSIQDMKSIDALMKIELDTHKQLKNNEPITNGSDSLQEALDIRKGQQAYLRVNEDFANMQGKIPEHRRELVENIKQPTPKARDNSQKEKEKMELNTWKQISRDEKLLHGNSAISKKADAHILILEKKLIKNMDEKKEEKQEVKQEKKEQPKTTKDLSASEHKSLAERFEKSIKADEARKGDTQKKTQQEELKEKDEEKKSISM